MARRKKFWIQGAIKNKGALRSKLGTPEGKNIPKGKLQAAVRKGGTTGRQARLAMTLKKLRRRKK